MDLLGRDESIKSSNNSNNNKHKETEMKCKRNILQSRKAALEEIYHKLWKTAILLY